MSTLNEKANLLRFTKSVMRKAADMLVALSARLADAERERDIALNHNELLSDGIELAQSVAKKAEAEREEFRDCLARQCGKTMVANAKIERLEARIAEYKTDREYIHGFNAGWEEGRAVLETALRFYGRESNWRSATMYMCGHAGASQAEVDRGAKARAAIAKETNDVT